MSYDLRLYFPHEEFPLAEWRNVMSLFDTEEYIPEPGGYRYDERSWLVTATWIVSDPNKSNEEPEIDPDTGQEIWVTRQHVHIDLVPIVPQRWGTCTPVGSHWMIRLSLSGRPAKAVWAMFAIPYYALGTIEGLTIHDCQWHNDDFMFSFQDAEEWAKFAAWAVQCRIGLYYDEPIPEERLCALIRNGILNQEGRVVF